MEKGIPRSNYFVGILQIRQPTEEVLDFIESELKKSKGVLVSRIKKVRGGYDYYFTNTQALLSIGKRLSSNFSGEHIVTSRIHTRDWLTSKDVYRVTVLFRCFPRKIKVGDIIQVKGEDVKISRISNKIYGKTIKKGKRISFSYSDIDFNQ